VREPTFDADLGIEAIGVDGQHHDVVAPGVEQLGRLLDLPGERAVDEALLLEGPTDGRASVRLVLSHRVVPLAAQRQMEDDAHSSMIACIYCALLGLVHYGAI
jgi:hypothetical protein